MRVFSIFGEVAPPRPEGKRWPEGRQHSVAFREWKHHLKGFLLKSLFLAVAFSFTCVGAARADLKVTSEVVGFDAVVVVRVPTRPNKKDDQQEVLRGQQSQTFKTFGQDVEVYVFDKGTRMLKCSGKGPAQGELKIVSDGVDWKLK